jgi:hypothetical protein
MHPYDQILALMKPKGEGRKDVLICPKSSKENVAETMHIIEYTTHRWSLISHVN